MQATDLLEVLSEIDDSFIAEADVNVIKAKRAKNRRLKITGVCVLTVALGVSIYAGVSSVKTADKPTSEPVAVTETVSPKVEAGANIPQSGNPEKITEPADETLEVSEPEPADGQISEHEHDYVVESMYAGNCQELGYVKYRCAVCGDTYISYTGYGPHSMVTDISMTGHYSFCSVCGLREYTPHNFVDGVCSCGFTIDTAGRSG